MLRKFTCFGTWTSKELTPITIDYTDLSSPKDLTFEIKEALGVYSLGVIGIKSIPNYSQNRLSLLNLARKLISLSPEQKSEIHRRNDLDIIGYREANTDPKDILDYLKASFYANPEVDSPLIPGDWADNLWPHSSVPELEPAFKTLGQQMIHVASLLSKHIDRMISSYSKSYVPDSLHTVISQHKNHISRLMYYYPQIGNSYDWNLWHKDFTTLTALTVPLYLHHSTGVVYSSDELGHPKTGLFVKNRNKETVKIKVDSDTLILQVGEIVQILSGGVLEATPHGVLNDGTMKDLSRVSFAVFMQPKGNFVMDSETPENVFIEHEGMYTLRGRWEPGMTFKEYITRTIKAL